MKSSTMLEHDGQLVIFRCVFCTERGGLVTSACVLAVLLVP